MNKIGIGVWGGLAVLSISFFLTTGYFHWLVIFGLSIFNVILQFKQRKKKNNQNHHEERY